MGKGIIAKKKSRRAFSVSSHELAKVERRWQKELDRMKLDATQDSTRLVQALVYLAILHTHPSWTWKAIASIQQEAERISTLIADPDSGYTWDDIYRELEEKGIGIDHD